MQKPGKIALGAATLWPFVYMLIFFTFIFSSILFMPGEPSPGAFPAMFAVIFALHLFTMLLTMGLSIFFIVDVFRNDRVDKDKKVLWAVVLFLGNMIAMPIYWYLYIWKEPAVAGNPLPGQLNSVNSSAWTNNASTSREEQHQYVPPREPPNWR
jgi:hypothetical protein